MSERTYQLVGANYSDTSEVPKDLDLFYRCTRCGDVIRSVPKENGGCRCGNIFIDKDYWRLAVEDFGQFEVVRRT